MYREKQAYNIGGFNNFLKDKLVFIIFGLAILIRLINLNIPILEGTAMRQVQTAMVARNFFKTGINILYPMVDHFGNRPGYLVLEFPFMGILSSMGYTLLGGVYEVIGRLWSLVFFCGSAVFLFRIVKKIFDQDTALFSLIAYGFSPLSIIFSRTFMPDFVMLFFVTGSLYFLLVYCDNNKLINFWCSAIFTSLALLAKPHSFYMFVPLTYLLWKKERFRLLVDYKNFLYLLLCIVPSLMWYLHARSVVNAIVPEQAYNFTINNWFNLRLLFNKKLYFDLLNIYSGIFLTPVGLTLLIMGLFIKTSEKENFIWAWLAGAGIFMVAFITHIDDPYYNLTMLPIASIFIGRALVFLKKADWKNTLLGTFIGKLLFSLIIVFFIARYAGYAYVVPNGYKYIVKAGEAVKRISEEESLIIASASGGAQGLYFCDRKGWPLVLPGIESGKTKEAIDKLERYRQAGARYYVSMVMDDFNKSLYFKEYMTDNYKVVERVEGEYIIFGLE